MTPEGKVKAKVKQLFKEYEWQIYYFMPVQTGYGGPGLDFHCSAFGKAFYVETKAPGKDLTPRQKITAYSMRQSGAKVFVVSGKDSLKELATWLSEQYLLHKANEHADTNTPV